LGDVLGHEFIYRVARAAGGDWEGALPLVRVRSRVFGHHLLSMPFLNYGGPVGTPKARRALTEDATRLAKATGVHLLELRSRRIPPEPPLTETHRKLTVVMNLPSDPVELWEKRIRAKVRSQIRRPQKEGMTARFGGGEAEPFYEVFSRNMRDLGTPVLPREFFEAIAKRFPDHVEFGCVYLKDTPVAAGCGFVWREEFEMTWASALRDYGRMAPNMLLYWSFMERMLERRVRAFNFGRCTPDSGTHHFKLQWGGRDEALHWGQWSDRGVKETPNPNRPVFAAASQVWRRLPLAIANRLGPRISRSIP
jgi:FemAB-related protein (PEP-CTERM system-associated)